MSYISAAQAKQIAQKAVDNLKDGTLVPKLAENLTPYAEDSGTTQTQPFFLEGTATGNGESRVDAKQVPAFAFLQEKRGNMVCVNQLAKELSNANWYASAVSVSFLDNVATFTASVQGGSIYSSIPLIEGHKYYICATIKLTTGTTSIVLRHQNNSAGSTVNSVDTTNWQQLVKIFEATSSSNGTFQVLDNRASDRDSIQVKDIRLIDLSQWFNGNIPAYLLSHPEAFGRYYKGSLAYEPGRLEPATGRYLTSVGRNIWDEEWEVGLVKETDGTDEANANAIRSKGYISVSASTQYYFKLSYWYRICWYDANKNFISGAQISTTNIVTAPANAIFMRFSTNATYGSTYKHDITISEYYSGESGYDKYYPYEVLATIDTGTESLYSAGSAYDSKVPSGLITRRIGSVDLGTLTCTAYEHPTLGTYFYAYVQSLNIKRLYPYNVAYPMICAKYLCVGRNADDFVDKTFCTDGNATSVLQLQFKDSAYTDAASFKTAMSGVMLYYELATPTTEQGTPFQENVPIDDFGPLSWSNTDVPQGNQIFYPVDYKAYEDTLIKYTDGDATSLALKSAITDAALNARGYYKMEDLSSEITLASGITATVKKAYKIRNQVFITVIAKNETGSELSSFAPLLSLGSGLYNASYTIALTPVQFNDENTMTFARVRFDGTISLKSPLPNETAVYLNLTYAVL